MEASSKRFELIIKLEIPSPIKPPRIEKIHPRVKRALLAFFTMNLQFFNLRESNVKL
jgi:hypothetical protein